MWEEGGRRVERKGRGSEGWEGWEKKKDVEGLENRGRERGKEGEGVRAGSGEGREGGGGRWEEERGR